MPQFVPCKNCGIRVAYTDLKPNASGVWVCSTCIVKDSKMLSNNPVQEVVGKPFAGSMVIDNRPKAMVVSSVPQVFNYKCESCNYNVQSTKDMGSKMCPYCGQKGALRLKKSSVQIVKEVVDMGL